MWRRHQLVRPDRAAWRRALAAADPAARPCIALWAERDLPLVVTRQRGGAGLALGLPAPLSFGRMKIALELAPGESLRIDAFPALAALAPPPAVAAEWQPLCDTLARCRCDARVYGGHGWQAITGLPYLHPASDLDLLLPVADAAEADRLCRLLAAASPALPRLDGELLWPDGAAVAWREWHGGARRLLVKRIDRVALEDRPWAPPPTRA